MGGGLMQLVAYGAQDIYLTGNPQITFFKVVYRRHTNFAMEAIEQTINGSNALTASTGNGTVTISRNGDLVHKVYVTSDTSAITDGDEIVNEVELEIGGQRIDKHYKEWNQIWNELSTSESKSSGLKSMKGCVGSSGTTGVGLVQVPLNFWFCRNPGLALPLIALQYHEVKLKFTWGTSTLAGAAAACKVVCDYIYLDTDERRRFAQVSHEYLIEQLQQDSASGDKTNSLNFNHPVKELIWTSAAINDYVNAKLKLNGHDRFSEQEEEYFQLRQPFDHHTAIPAQNLPLSAYSHELAKGSFSVAGVSTKTGTAGDSPAIGVGTQPANTRITKITLVCTTAVTMGSGDVGAEVGTSSSGAQVAATATDDIIDAGTAIAINSVFNVPLVGTLTSGTGPLADVKYTAVARKLYFNLINSVAASANAGGAFTFIVEYEATSAGAAAAYVPSGCRTSKMTKKVNVYSFALKPEEHQPSGTCNFSRIDNAQLETNVALGSTDTIYAVNYNVLRIMSGMGGLAYSN